uniref:Signal peptidase complex subunit 3 n=1 Tax=Gossypium raimondii TaxID=29730 RepID=A0A0D2TGS9_GOSRA|nr:hypothetical protein B456_009G106800 [Gossypium raimondii]
MHSFGHRLNGLLTFSVTILAIMCAIASLSDNLNAPSPTAEIKIMNINWFQKQPQGNDEVSLTMNISADLQSLFTWNTKQLFIFVAAEYETPKNSLNQVRLNTACCLIASSFLRLSRKYLKILGMFLIWYFVGFTLGCYNTCQRACEVLDPYLKQVSFC